MNHASITRFRPRPDVPLILAACVAALISGSLLATVVVLHFAAGHFCSPSADAIAAIIFPPLS